MVTPPFAPFSEIALGTASVAPRIESQHLSATDEVRRWHRISDMTIAGSVEAGTRASALSCPGLAELVLVSSERAQLEQCPRDDCQGPEHERECEECADERVHLASFRACRHHRRLGNAWHQCIYGWFFSDLTDASRLSRRDDGPRRKKMHIVMTSLIVALVICVVLLGAFGLFTRTAAARRIEEAERPARATGALTISCLLRAAREEPV
jgi:hypothetical protein